MQVSVTFRHMPASGPLRLYAQDKVRHAVEKFVHAAEMEAHIVLSMERFWHIADFTVVFKGMTARVEERTEDMYSSIDKAMDKLERQVRRYKDKLRDYKANMVDLAPSGGKYSHL